MGTKTATSVVANSLTSATVTYGDGSTQKFAPNSILDLGYGALVTDSKGNKDIIPPIVPIPMLHAALTAFHSAQVTAATQAGSDAVTAAMEPGHAKLASLFAKGSLTADDIKAGAAIVADLRKTQRERALAKAQKAAADAQAALTALQANTGRIGDRGSYF